ncbi:class I SAM-dependent methyltransferase [Alteraurantiacibacter buctensis]|uniref:Methyltransferase n=1 Tax=Alteraurantiacibacter buctensis TaxID=1503981 RepID=A0A844Z3F4_9SPHN|nr:methyltransferase [Alteraurantiacibacter buctensis]MXO73214.1 methyltransferase [Alteraurantiacibacter buctensis]
MNGNELAASRTLPRLKAKVKRALGPAGVFFRGFLEHPRMVGAILPSGPAVVKTMLSRVDWSNTKLFVEYGPGVGTFCQPVLDRLLRDADLVVIDTNPLYIDFLRQTITDSRFHAVLGSAEDVEEIVRSIGHQQADYVLSGLPFSTLPEGVGPAIAAATQRVIRQGGAFLTYQYAGAARDLSARYFPRVDSQRVWLNVPPCLLAWAWQD